MNKIDKHLIIAMSMLVEMVIIVIKFLTLSKEVTDISYPACVI